ncbi:MAG TPA: hypothetical protein VE400_17795 [Mycobacterium sp.]|nr:hypothetical protein [Mycobacterium sp.]
MSATAADDVKRLTGLHVVVTARQRAQWLQPLLAGESVVDDVRVPVSDLLDAQGRGSPSRRPGWGRGGFISACGHGRDKSPLAAALTT